MGPLATALSAPTPSPLAICLAVGLTTLALFAGLVLIDALAARAGRRDDERRAATRAADEAARIALAGPAFPAAPAPGAGPLALSEGEVARMALARLARFAAVATARDLGADPGREQLARFAVFSAYRDCVALGLGAQARALLHARPDDLARAAELVAPAPPVAPPGG